MTADGQSDFQPAQEPFRLVLGVCLFLLALDVGLRALLFDRLPETIAIHRSATGTVDSAGHRDLVWFGPMAHAFIIGLWLVSRRHTKPYETRLLTAVIAVPSLYLFSLNTLGLLSNLDNERWQQASVDTRWMLLALTLPALTYAVGLYVYRATIRQRRGPSADREAHRH